EGFEKSGAVPAVGRDSAGLRADFILETDLREFSAIYDSPTGPPRAAVAFNVKLIKIPERKIIGVHSVTRQQPAAADTIPEILREVTEGADDIAAWQRYPAGEVYDPANHAQYFYHCHAAPAGSAPGAEHGHFHLFLRAEGIPAGITPLVLPELAVANAPVPPQSAPLKRGERDEVVHLVALALDQRGEPVRLFTTNRWVTGETWYCADDVIRMLD